MENKWRIINTINVIRVQIRFYVFYEVRGVSLSGIVLQGVSPRSYLSHTRPVGVAEPSNEGGRKYDTYYEESKVGERRGFITNITLTEL